MVERRIDTVKRKEFSLKSIQIGGGFEFSKLKFAENSVFFQAAFISSIYEIYPEAFFRLIKIIAMDIQWWNKFFLK